MQPDSIAKQGGGLIASLFKQSLRHFQQGNADQAVALYKTVIKHNLHSPSHWQNYGVMLRKAGLLQDASIAYQQALRLDKSSASSWSNLGNVLGDLDRFQEALPAHKNALMLETERGGDAVISRNYAISLREDCQFESAQKCFEVLLRNTKYQTEGCLLEWEIAICLLYQQKFDQAWPYYESRFKAKGITRPEIISPRWQGEVHKGLRLLVLEEQGFGDIIFASRLVGILKSKGVKVLLCCRSELHTALSNAGAEKIFSIEDVRNHQFDCYTDLMSLFGLMNIDCLNPPEPVCIAVDSSPRLSSKIIQKTSAQKNIALVWSGSETFTDNRRRSLCFEFYQDLLATPGTQFYSLQKGEAAKQLEQSPLSPLVIDLSDSIRSFADTAFALKKMDLLISVDTSVAHLAASMGVPVLLLLQFKPYWIWGLQGEGSAWYPSVTMLRQEKPGDWQSVKDQLNDRLLE